MAVKPIPDGFHTVTPYLLVPDTAGLVEFLKRAFDAEEIHVSKGPDGNIVHATMKIGDSMVMMGQARDEWKPMPSMIYLYVEDVDAWYDRAIKAGGTSVREINDEAYGDRAGGVQDPAGNQWWIATHKQDMPAS
ncbi:MAG TPA: VOC family protein [Thermoanaerobaculia bacterium]|nr:VOC family protein [Thermoanaerobaculia bacterium]